MRPDKYGFPARHAPKAKFFIGFVTGDMVKADILSGKYAGKYTGRIAIRFRPSFMLLLREKRFDVHPKYLRTIQRAMAMSTESKNKDALTGSLLVGGNSRPVNLRYNGRPLAAFQLAKSA